MTLRTERVRMPGQVRAFVEGGAAVDFTGAGRESVSGFVCRALVRLDYERLARRLPDSGVAVHVHDMLV